MFLNSLKNQSFQDFEVIIVDGGSTDKSLQIIAKFFSQLKIKLIVDTKRNLGYIRNCGAAFAQGKILLSVNTDNYLEPELLEKLLQYYSHHPECVSVSGRVFPLGTNLMAHVAYQLFDFLRFVFTCAPMPIKKYRPSGNFMSIRRKIFNEVNGYPEVSVNEDGLMGMKLDPYAKRNHKAVMFNLKFYVGHHVKKFEDYGGIQAIFFYFYTLSNFFPLLKLLLKPFENNARLVFEGKQPKRLTLRMLIRNFWEWL